MTKAGSEDRRHGAGRMRLFAWCLCLVAATVSLAGSARAQDVAPAVPSPLRLEPERNGVNVVDGQIDIPGPELGVPAAPRLHFRRLSDAMPRVNGVIAQTQPGEYPRRTFSFHTASATSDAFSCIDDWDCTSRTGTGSTIRPLGNGITYRQAGTGAIFQYTLVVSNTSTAYAAFATSASYPDGDSLSYTYGSGVLQGSPSQTVYRASRITSSAGYYIQFTFASNDINADLTGWLTLTKAELFRGGTTPVLLQSLTYNSAAGTATDMAGRVFQCVDCSSGLVGSGELVHGALILPGETTPAIQATWISSSSQVVGSVTRDGVAWTYSYGNLRFNAQNGQFLYDSLTVAGPNGYHDVYALHQQIDAPNSPRNVITSITDSLGHVTSYQFDSNFRPTQVTYPEGNSVVVQYDDFGNITSRVTHAKPGSGLPNLTETAHYVTSACTLLQTDVSCYRPDHTIDARGHQTDYLYNAAGQVTERTEPADADGVRRKTYVTYTTSWPSRPSVVRVCGATTTCGTTSEIRTEYDYWGSTALPTAVRRIDAAHGVTLETDYTYDNAGHVLSEDGPLAGTADTKYYCYDVLGRRTGAIGPAGANGLRPATRTTYRDSDDKVTRVESGTMTATSCASLATAMTVLNQVDTAYDTHRNPIREAVSSGGTTYTLTQRTFDDRGQLTCEAVRMNPATFASPPSSACTLGTAGSYGGDRITHNVYDNAGQLTQIQRAYGIAGLQQNYATYTYTANGQRASVTDANGNRASMTWDGYDRQSRWNFPSPATPGVTSTTDYEQYGYDAAGNRTSLRKRDGSVLTYSYDNLNRMIRKAVPASASGAEGYYVYYAYDMANLQLYARFGTAGGVVGAGITNSYDTLGRLLTTNNTMNGFNRTLSYQYDAGSRRTRLTFPDGQFFTYAYDGAGDLTAILQGGVTTVATFGYDSAGRLASRASTGAGASYGYDAIGRLSSLGLDLAGTASDRGQTFGYNPASQVVTRTSSNDAYATNSAYAITRLYAHNGLNQYTSAGGATFTYDANGNLTSDGATTYVYDAENRLVSASGAHNATLSYDPLGRLYDVNGGATRFVYDGDELVLEQNIIGQTLRRYVHGAGNDDPILWYEGSSLTSRRALLADHQGSIVAVADAAGNTIAINGYDSWGIPNVDANGDAIVTGRFGYTGQAWLPELGMWYYKARIYSPSMGRFLQTDPVGYDDQINLYAYVGNDPVNGADPSGMANTCSRVDSTACSGSYAVSKSIICAACHRRSAAPAPPPPSPISTMSRPPTTNSSPANRTRSASNTQDQTPPNRIRVQIQGRALTTKNLPARNGSRTASTPIQSSRPITAYAVREALSATRAQLSPSDQALVEEAYDKAIRFVSRAEAQGGIVTPGGFNRPFTGGLDAGQLRVDIEFLTPGLHLVPE